MKSRVAFVTIVWLTLGTGAGAQSDDTRSTFWREVREPGHQRAQTLMRHGLRFLILAEEQVESPFRRTALLESAIERLRRAHEAWPTEPRALFLLGRAYHRYEQPSLDGGDPTRRVDQAIQSFLALRALDEEYEAEAVAFELGNLYSRAHDYGRAIEEYQRSLDHALGSRLASITESNLAEVYMHDRQLVVAVAHYEQAVRLSREHPDQSQSLVLALWGLAVALDRLGEHHSALVKAREALSAGGGHMDALTSDGVYFEPAAEIHFYQGLGHMAGAEGEIEADERIAQLRQARASWRAYLRLSTEDDPWRSLAERHAREVDGLIESARAAP